MTTEGLYRELHGRLLSFVRRRVATEQDAEDIVHDVFTRIHAHRAQLPDTESVSGWVHRVTRNAITDHHRSAAVAERAHEKLGHEAATLAEAPTEHPDEPGIELARCVAPLLAQLPEEYRDALQMTELGGLSQRDAAAEVGLSLPGMKSRVQRGRVKLGQLLLACCEVELDSRQGVMGYEPRRQRDDTCACRPDAEP